MPAIMASLATDSSEFATKTLELMKKKSPLMMCVTLSQLQRAAKMDIADCLRMERTMVRRCFEHGEVFVLDDGGEVLDTCIERHRRCV